MFLSEQLRAIPEYFSDRAKLIKFA